MTRHVPGDALQDAFESGSLLTSLGMRGKSEPFFFICAIVFYSQTAVYVRQRMIVSRAGRDNAALDREAVTWIDRRRLTCSVSFGWHSSRSPRVLRVDIHLLLHSVGLGHS